MRWMILTAPLVLAACGGPTPEEEEAARQAAVAEVEANQKPPPEQLDLDPIRYAEIEKYELYGMGCSFTPDGGGLGTVALAQDDKGYLIRNDELLIHAADLGSKELPYGARRKYDGRKFSFTLDLDEASRQDSDIETSDYRGELTVRDGDDRVVYQAKGPVQCGA